MAMGFGCNAAGVIATRVIDSPRERLVAILTNNFVPCNGRFPTLIMLATVFVGAAFRPAFASLAAAGSGRRRSCCSASSFTLRRVVGAVAHDPAKARRPRSRWNCRPIDGPACCGFSTPR